MKLMSELDLTGRRVLIREDLNVPLREGEIANDARLRAAAPSILAALEQGAAVIVMSHLGRPTEGEWSEDASMAPIARRLAELLGRDVLLATEWRQVAPLPGDVVLLENVRFNIGEAADDAALSADYASLCDVFVMDAFGTAHRAQASTHGVVHSAPVACAGPLLHAELTALERALTGAQKPMLAVVGGSKVSTKLEVLDQLSKRCDSLVVGGGIANTFLAAAGYPVGQSLCEWDLIETARRLCNRTGILENVFHCGTDFIGAHRDHVINALANEPKGLLTDLCHGATIGEKPHLAQRDATTFFQGSLNTGSVLRLHADNSGVRPDIPQISSHAGQQSAAAATDKHIVQRLLGLSYQLNCHCALTSNHVGVIEGVNKGEPFRFC